MVEGRSKQAFKAWLAARDQAWRDQVEVVAMDGFTGFKTATTEELPQAVAVMDPFHVVRLAGDALDGCRRRAQQDLHGHRGRKDDPLYRARRTLHTGTSLLTEKQHARLDALFAVDAHVEVEATWAVYQRIVGAYRNPDRTHGRAEMQAVIDTSPRPSPPHCARSPPSAGPSPNEPATSSPTSTGPARATDRPKPSTDASNTSEVPRSASATSPTTSPEHCSRAAASDPDYTLHCEEPSNSVARRFRSTYV